MKILSPIQKLDLVLDFLANNIEAKPSITDGDIFSALQKLHPELRKQNDFGTDLIRILNKLVKEGNVDFCDTNFGNVEGLFGTQKQFTRTYQITFDGKLLSESGGFQEAHKSAEARKFWEDQLLIKGEKNGERLNKLTLILSIGTIGLALIEIIKLFKGQ